MKELDAITHLLREDYRRGAQRRRELVVNKVLAIAIVVIALIALIASHTTS
jgi:hypothetical protein